ncbi:MAG: DUF4920 domain-containing protein [Candidatus Eisenbacteria bacterium]
MRKTQLIVCALAATAFALAGCARDAEKAGPYYTAGAPITLKQAVALAVLKADPRAHAGENILIEGTVSGVCKGSGCWVLVRDAAGNEMYAKSPDHSVTVPMDCEGARIRVEGPLAVIEPAVAEAGEEAEAHGEGEEGHVCPQPDCFVTLAAVELIRK